MSPLVVGSWPTGVPRLLLFLCSMLSLQTSFRGGLFRVGYSGLSISMYQVLRTRAEVSFQPPIDDSYVCAAFYMIDNIII